MVRSANAANGLMTELLEYPQQTIITDTRHRFPLPEIGSANNPAIFSYKATQPGVAPAV